MLKMARSVFLEILFQVGGRVAKQSGDGLSTNPQIGLGTQKVYKLSALEPHRKLQRCTTCGNFQSSQWRT
jgi:hypothetical protein